MTSEIVTSRSEESKVPGNWKFISKTFRLKVLAKCSKSNFITKPNGLENIKNILEFMSNLLHPPEINSVTEGVNGIRISNDEEPKSTVESLAITDNKNSSQSPEIADVTTRANCSRVSRDDEPKVTDEPSAIPEITESKNFLQPPEIDTDNGFLINGRLVPEIIRTILHHVSPEHLLNLTLVCKSWCRMLRSSEFWYDIYKRTHRKKIKVYPWRNSPLLWNSCHFV